MKKFNIGDKVRLARGSMFGWEDDFWWEIDGLKIYDEYIVEHVDNDKNIILEGYAFTHHPDHFDLVKGMDKYVVKLTQDEVDALVLVTGSARSVYSNDYKKTLRSYTSHIFNYIYNTLNIVSTDVFSEQPASTFKFLK
jgi:hypothetical protein